jgi:hypothetical protein
MKDFPNQPPYSAETFAAWLREHCPVRDPREVEYFESEEEYSDYLKELEEKGDYFAFQIHFPILAKREINKPIKLDDGTTITADSGSSRTIVVHSADYDECVSDFAAKLESLGWEGRLSSLDLAISFSQGRQARRFAKE